MVLNRYNGGRGKIMKRLIVCCDGTWNTPDQEDNGVPAPTNVFKLYNAITEFDGDIEQKKYYHVGVGAEGGALDAVAGGLVGKGVSKNLREAYHWLGFNYDEGDEIYIFGFSRGAFIARCLGGFLGRGLLDLRGLPYAEALSRVEIAYRKGYRKKNASVEEWAKDDWMFFHHRQATPVCFIGVWDTVGALGVPDDLEVLNILERKKNWHFHDTALGNNVKTARHAMAIDEIRSSFCVTRWSNAHEHPGVQELWFPGCHSDVGGGYAVCDLSNGALLWMMDESEKAGLTFRSGIKDNIKANPLGVIHNSFKGPFAKLRSRPRNIEAMTTENAALFHSSALDRKKHSPIEFPPYHPTILLSPGNTSRPLEIFADRRWNYTGIYLEAGAEYLFSAEGEWQDSQDVCDWEGTEDGKLTPGDVVRGVSSFIGVFENAFQKLTKNESTDFLGTKRVEKLKWFTLIGAIANDSGSRSAVKNDGSPVPHQYVELASYENKTLKIDKPGYLYCFPNDVWVLYGNNSGSIRLTVTRKS